jgi:dihydropteroate synthase
MGVINITPNSFSDGGFNLSTAKVRQKIQDFRAYTNIFDFGAESTAPMNDAISVEEEWTRIESYLLELIDDLHEDDIISLDTYKSEVFLKFYELARKSSKRVKLIWNDVSGKDDDLLNTLFNDDNFQYVCSHNLCPTRTQTTDHMNFLYSGSSESLLSNMIEYFQQFINKYLKFKNQIIIDPCFGFSKSREQNHFILKNFENFLTSFNERQKFLIGISKKSFLRFPADLDVKSIDGSAKVEQEACALMANILKIAKNQHFYFRCHHPESVQNIDFAAKSLILN